MAEECLETVGVSRLLCLVSIVLLPSCARHIDYIQPVKLRAVVLDAGTKQALSGVELKDVTSEHESIAISDDDGVIFGKIWLFWGGDSKVKKEELQLPILRFGFEREGFETRVIVKTFSHPVAEYIDFGNVELSKEE